MNLENRIKRLEIEAGRVDEVNEPIYRFVRFFAGESGKPVPKRSNDVNETLRQLAEVLPS